ncbi:hypothetical protein GF373_03920 [bacterium]|nr:hypothetical protein [bacterium]
MRASSDVVGEGLQNEARTNLGFLAKSIDEKAQKDGYNLSLKDGDFVWGSNAAILQNAVVLLLADHTSPNPSYRQSAMSHLHYILGCNPLSKCYVTGVGNNPPRHPHHPGSMHIKNQLPVPGLLVGGPNQFLNDSELKRHFNESSPPAITYKDSRDSYSSNDISISWNAALAFVIAFLIN